MRSRDAGRKEICMIALPKPKKVEEGQGFYEVSFKSRIVIDETLCDNAMTYAGLLQACLKKSSGITCAVARGQGRTGDILLSLSPALKEQEYHLTVDKDGIRIAGGDGAAVLYGVQTLHQILEQYGCMVPCVRIEDAPDMPNRGYFFDQTRGRVLTLEALKRLVDQISRYKINQLQLYVEHTYLFRDLTEMWRDETPLTAQDILELDAYCRKLHVELVPSMASFGHLYMLLSTRSYGDLCERSHPWTDPFSFKGRMDHHTLNPTDERALALIKEMIAEYGALFTSDKFNICADETFDLGSEKSRETAQREGVSKMYIGFVQELCRFLTEQGKQPMFFGDIICGNPEFIHLLPQDTLCLTWGYAPQQREDECRAMAQAGANQYLCPGVCGWNQWINLIENSYQNIRRMCEYGMKYQVQGILNTDWGDFGHINDPAFSVPGMIYGASFSWNHEAAEFEEMNRQISLLEYGDDSQVLVGLMDQLAKQSLFDWHAAVTYYEKQVLHYEFKVDTPIFESVEQEENVDRAEEKISLLMQQIKETAVHLREDSRPVIEVLELAGEAIGTWNRAGAFLYAKECGRSWNEEEAFRLAGRLENWFMAYKKQWRKSSREGDLHRIARIVFWYADCLRGNSII